MPDATEARRQIEAALQAFGAKPLREAGLGLLETLGYRSAHPFKVSGLDEFRRLLDQKGRLNEKQAFTEEWKTVEFLCQVTDDDVVNSTQGRFTFANRDGFEPGLIQSYLFLAIDLPSPAQRAGERKKKDWTRTELAQITRAVNRVFDMPAMLFFRHGETLTFSVIDRRLHKRDATRDVLEKVTLIKDIRVASPHRAHVEIFHDLSIEPLHAKHEFDCFDGLHKAWRDTLNIEALNKRFYGELRDWYFWALDQVCFPKDAPKQRDGNRERDYLSLIRLLTRLVFCWFLKEKRLIPSELFEGEKLRRILKDFDPERPSAKESTYYRAILQNLFFATLSVPSAKRKFIREAFQGHSKHYGDQFVFRFQDSFAENSHILRLFKDVPFLNGGLFECLDRVPGRLGHEGREIRIDGFSTRAEKQPRVPDLVFFASRLQADLKEFYGTEASRQTPVRGLLEILGDYKFTVEESTPIEEEVALDPELLGRVFEELLAAYNPETGNTVRKATGSYYTPREIVTAMVDEALIACLKTQLEGAGIPPNAFGASSAPNTESRLRDLFAYNGHPNPFDEKETQLLLDAVDSLKILDPACGSGAFPMGALHQLVHILGKLDPENTRWREVQRQRAIRETEAAYQIGDKDQRRKRLAEIDEAFEQNSSGYGRKLYLIENGLYGVDIQPIAVQIAKLRFFISLVVEQKDTLQADNRGIRPLPNLDFKLIAANTLVSLPRSKEAEGQATMNLEDAPFLARFRALSRSYFSETDASRKLRLRENMEKLIREHAEQKVKQIESRTRAEKSHFREELRKRYASQIARLEREKQLWESYPNLFQEKAVAFFEPEWMFGLATPAPGAPAAAGFDVVLGNPPFVRADEQSEWNRHQREEILATGTYETLWEKWDLFIPFIEKSFKLLAPGGVVSLIVSDAFCHSKYAQKPQNWFLQNSRILRLDFLSNLQIFDAAVRNMTFLFQKADGAAHQPLRCLHEDEFGQIRLLTTGAQRQLSYRVFFPEDNQAKEYAAATLTLASLCYITKGMVVHANERVAQGAFTLEDLVSTIKDRKHPKPFVEGKLLDRWLPLPHRWLEWGTERAPALFSRPTFSEIYEVPEKLMSVDMATGVEQLRVAYDDKHLLHNHSAWSFVPWHSLSGVRNNSLKKTARYKNERPPRPDLPRREELEATSRRFSVKYLLAVMNSSVARDFLRANRRSNIHLYPDDWKKLPIPDVPAEKQAPVVALVEEILAAKRMNPRADLSALETQVDDLVRALYGVVSPAAPARPLPEGDLKEFLRVDCLPTLGKRFAYFNMGDIRAFMKAHQRKAEGATLKIYLSELMDGLFVFDAGKGWYTFVKEPFELDPAPTAPLVHLLESKFPLLDFACWSTEQIKTHVHQTLSKFASFVYVERHNLAVVFEALRDAGWNAFLDPSREEIEKVFALREKTVVVRPSIGRQPVEGRLATIEKLLVDLYVERRDLPLMDVAEYRRMFANLARSRRIKVSGLLAYAERRKIEVSELFEHEEHTISTS